VDESLRTAAEVMLTTPARHPLSATVGEIREFFRDDHVHAALIVSPAGYLEAVVERDDIDGWRALDAAAAPLGRLAGRIVPAGASLAEVRRAMTAAGGGGPLSPAPAAGFWACCALRRAGRASALSRTFAPVPGVRPTLLPSAAQASTDLDNRQSFALTSLLTMATVICVPQTTVSGSFS
jgi:hypothetical protein